MKKKQVIAIAAALAAVLLMSTAVYAIGNMGAENNQAGNPAEQAPPNTAGTEEMEALQTLTAEQVDISEFSVPLGTKAEQILREALVKKPGQQMTEREIERYNNKPDTIKQLTYEEARAKQDEFQDEWDEIQADLKPWTEYTEAEKEHIGEVSHWLYIYKDYADSIATGKEWVYVRYEGLKHDMESALADAENWIVWSDGSQYDLNHKALCEFLLIVIEDMSEDVNIANDNEDYASIISEIDLISNYKALQHMSNLEQISPELMAQYTQRYQAGESITEILG